MNLEEIFANYQTVDNTIKTNYNSTEELLTISAYMIRIMGYCSRKNANGYDKYATADYVSNFLNDARSKHEWIKSDGPLTDKDKEIALATIEWGKNQETHLDNDYLWNVNRIANSEFVQNRMIGIIASMVFCYLKTIVIKETYEDAYFGEIKQRFEAEAIYNFINFK